MIGVVYAAVLTLAALLGAVIGSFLNVVIYRVPAGESVIRPASHCPRCGVPIRARHNLPIVSYLLLRGRCASCRAPISPRYPLVEAATAALFVGTVVWALAAGLVPLLPALLYLVAIGVALTMIDIDVHRLPNSIVLPSYPVLIALLATAAVISGDGWALARAGLAGAALFGFYALLALIYPAGMGWGDVKLAGLIGLMLGYIGWAALLVGAFAAFLLGSVLAVMVIATRRGTGKTALPFGPFVLLGAAIGIVAGRALVTGYLGLVGL